VAVQSIPGVGPILGAVFVAEVGDVHRFARAEELTCWAGLTPKHHESAKHVHRGRITKHRARSGPAHRDLAEQGHDPSTRSAPRHQSPHPETVTGDQEDDRTTRRTQQRSTI
jgi:hypothetical protein